ncbi:MAG: PmoA family protein [Planctomycetaceae bacterium]|jgi:hypothetical protein|nr:PmoA family protein [Planctomycetaceae bacterium]
MKKILIFSMVVFLCLIFNETIFCQEILLHKIENGYQINIDRKMYARYITNFSGTPIVWPVIGPSERLMTRQFPMSEEDKSEKHDHPHHRSLWFNHDGVNGNRHWMKSPIVHQEFLKAESNGKIAILVTKNHWLDETSGNVVCSDIRTLKFGVIPDVKVRYIDFDVTVTAEQEKVTFADTKEGSFGIRVPSSMDVDAKKGGGIVNAQGDKNDAAWGKRSDWVDYSGPADGATVGITGMNHPDSFRYPTYWHVRTYGLLAANPFGVSAFENDKSKSGELVLKKGESFTLMYRILFHDGSPQSLDIPKFFREYAASHIEK